MYVHTISMCLENVIQHQNTILRLVLLRTTVLKTEIGSCLLRGNKNA